MTTREEEMAKLKARYAQTRGGAVPNVETKKEVSPKKQNVVTIKYGPSFAERIKDFVTPYLHIIENDIRRVLGLKSREELIKEKTYDPLLAIWKRGRNLQ